VEVYEAALGFSTDGPPPMKMPAACCGGGVLHSRQGLSAEGQGIRKAAIFTGLSPPRKSMDDSIAADLLIPQNRHECPVVAEHLRS